MSAADSKDRLLAEQRLTTPPELKRFYPPGYKHTPDPRLVEAELEHGKRVESLIPTCDGVYALLYGVRHNTLQKGDLKVREEPELLSIFASHPPNDKGLDPIDKLSAVGEERVTQIKAVIDDLKAEGVDQHIPLGVNKEAALVAFATCYQYKQELAKQIANMTPKERDTILSDLKKWPHLFKSLDTDSSHDYGLLPMVKENDSPVLSRYFNSGGHKIHRAISAVQQLKRHEEKAGMPLINDPGLDNYLLPWLSTEMYVPESPKTNKGSSMDRGKINKSGHKSY